MTCSSESEMPTALKTIYEAVHISLGEEAVEASPDPECESLDGSKTFLATSSKFTDQSTAVNLFSINSQDALQLYEQLLRNLGQSISMHTSWAFQIGLAALRCALALAPVEACLKFLDNATSQSSSRLLVLLAAMPFSRSPKFQAFLSAKVCIDALPEWVKLNLELEGCCGRDHSEDPFCLIKEIALNHQEYPKQNAVYFLLISIERINCFCLG